LAGVAIEERFVRQKPPWNDTQELLPFGQNSNTHVSAKLLQGQETMGWYCAQKDRVEFCDVMNLELFLRHRKEPQLFADVRAPTRLYRPMQLKVAPLAVLLLSRKCSRSPTSNLPSSAQ